MRIGIIIGRIGGIDSVALETEKWIEVLNRMGHQTYVISGQVVDRSINPEYETVVPEMSFFSPENYWIRKKAFFYPDSNEDELMDHIDLYSKAICEKITDWAHEKKIDLMVSENVSAFPAHLEMSLAIKKAFQTLGLPSITHDHDFIRERDDRFISPYKNINDLIDNTYPLRLPNSIHAVLNSHDREILMNKFNRNSVIVPYVMDFDKPFGILTEENKYLHQNLGYESDDILLFQTTRILRNKGIETAIKLVYKLENKKIKLIVTGNYIDDAGEYYMELTELIHLLKLENQVHFAYQLINNKGLASHDSEQNYSLSDAYAHARACTYFSTYEGFGNTFVEAVSAKRPVFVNNYKPVFWTDIGSKGFKTVMIEDGKLTDKAIGEIKEIIYNKDLNREIGEYNHSLGKKLFSYDTLKAKLKELLEKAVNAA